MGDIRERVSINWLQQLRGGNMLLVVLMHAGLYDLAGAVASEPLWFDTLCRFFYPFRMPLFMAISGFLFCLTRIDRGTPYLQTMRDKLYRVGVPYLFLTTVTLGVKPLLGGLMKRPTTFNMQEYLHAIIYPAENPLLTLWFLGALSTLFCLYPIYRWSVKHRYREVLLVAIGCAAQFLPEYRWGGIMCNYLALRYLVWFYIGILACKYKLYSRIIDVRYVWLYAVAYVALFFLPDEMRGVEILYLAKGALGCVIALYLAIYCDRGLPRLFNSFSGYTFQIYLLSPFIHWGVRFLFSKVGCPALYLPFFLLNALLAIYLPVVVAICVERINSRYLSPLIGLKWNS